jgi:hypothetical protein
VFFGIPSFGIARRAHIDLLILLAIVVILFGAGAAWLIESKTNPNFTSYGDSIWWALNMFSNVAYVEFHPSSLGGRIVAMILEFTGIAFIGLFTASLAKALLTISPRKKKIHIRWNNILLTSVQLSLASACTFPTFAP